MNLEAIQERLKALQEDFQRSQNYTTQLAGAIADCNYWLTQILNEESKNAASEKHDA